MTDDITEGEVAAFEVAGRWIAVARDGGRLYAFEDECTHAECPLSRGLVLDGQIECDCHGAMFDLATGEATKLPATEPVEVFVVHEDDGGVFVEVPS